MNINQFSETEIKLIENKFNKLIFKIIKYVSNTEEIFNRFLILSESQKEICNIFSITESNCKLEFYFCYYYNTPFNFIKKQKEHLNIKYKPNEIILLLEKIEAKYLT